MDIFDGFAFVAWIGDFFAKNPMTSAVLTILFVIFCAAGMMYAT